MKGCKCLIRNVSDDTGFRSEDRQRAAGPEMTGTGTGNRILQGAKGFLRLEQGIQNQEMQ
ncbi:MAG TPA: hypothetical protein PLO24_12750 [Bacteroidales bacterium]|nr:hypothetical protein [Bacteroidales bacterium]HOS73629.1 hypothetical protein [Bacteroidales bacterium]HQH24504.1 hypothetical protein [Bacteroidales bacterium]HQJ83337.1 hypothetical protein [Bacteroidales bacterium]